MINDANSEPNDLVLVNYTYFSVSMPFFSVLFMTTSFYYNVVDSVSVTNLCVHSDNLVHSMLG